MIILKELKESFFSLISSLYVGLFIMYAHVCIGQKTLVGVDSLLLPHGSWELISGLQTIHQTCFQMSRDSTSPLVLERTSSMLIRKNWQKFKIEDTLITCIWSLHNVYVNCNATLFLISVYKYVMWQSKKEKKHEIGLKVKRTGDLVCTRPCVVFPALYTKTK